MNLVLYEVREVWGIGKNENWSKINVHFFLRQSQNIQSTCLNIQ